MPAMKGQDTQHGYMNNDEIKYIHIYIYIYIHSLIMYEIYMNAPPFPQHHSHQHRLLSDHVIGQVLLQWPDHDKTELHIHHLYKSLSVYLSPHIYIFTQHQSLCIYAYISIFIYIYIFIPTRFSRWQTKLHVCSLFAYMSYLHGSYTDLKCTLLKIIDI